MGLSGTLIINEETGSSVSKTSGSLIIKHKNLNGASSIVFPSSTPTDGGDYGYIKYIDDINNNGSATPYGGENARLVIGLDNDNTGDSIVLMTPQSNGYVGINKMNPRCALDVSGNVSISGNFGINKTSPTCALDVTGDGKLSGTLTSGNIGINKTPTCALDVTGDGKISGTLTANNLIITGGAYF